MCDIQDSMPEYTIVFTRCGTGLMEIVFEPDLFDGEEAASLVKELSLILQVFLNWNFNLMEIFNL